jgi:hypothetical protein
MPPESAGISGRLTLDLPLGYLQGGFGIRGVGSGASIARRASETSETLSLVTLEDVGQGYLAHKKQPPPRTLQQDHA